MQNDTIKTDILIIGGGAVGLFLGCRLAWLGIDFRIVEVLKKRPAHSRSIGIHPPSLEYLERMALADRFLKTGLKITDGLAIGDDGILGSLTFKTCPGPYRFIMTLPQSQTEHILEAHLQEICPAAMIKGYRAFSYDTDGGRSIVTCKNEDDTECRFNTGLIIGCDGKQSTVRNWMGLSFEGASYPDTFLMADYDDTTNFGSSAAIYFQEKGLIESFPLPGNTRRWVVRTDAYVNDPSSEKLVGILESRTGFDMRTQAKVDANAFGVQHYMTRISGRDNMVVIGDAAHIVSPFGGQGMNLGWMDAWQLADLIHNVSFKSISWTAFNWRRRLAAWQAIKRAEFNMWMGRAHRFPHLNELFIKALLSMPTRLILPRLFTMRWL